MSDAQKQSSSKSTKPPQQRSTSAISYIVALCKQGVPPEQAFASNNLWLSCGMTRVLLGNRYYDLQVLEGADGYA
jgi:hypothetical protein